MTKDDELLLGNMLDSLDRLYDRECGVADVYALFFATARALARTDLCPQIEQVLPKLLSIIQTIRTAEMRRHAALTVTDELRKILARELPIEGH